MNAKLVQGRHQTLLIRFAGRFAPEVLRGCATKVMNCSRTAVVVYDMRAVKFDVPVWEIISAAKAHQRAFHSTSRVRLGVLVGTPCGVGMMHLFRIKLDPASQNILIAGSVSELLAWFSSEPDEELVYERVARAA